MKFRNKLLTNIKDFFSHNENRVVKETGVRTLGLPIGGSVTIKSTNELLNISYFVRCIQIIGNDIGSMKWTHQRQVFKDGKEYWENVSKSGIEHLVNERPNLEITGFEFKKILIWNYFLYGAAAIYVVRDTDDNIVELIPIFTNWIKREVVNGVPKYIITWNSSDTSQNAQNKNPLKGQETILTDKDVIWISYEILDSYRFVEIKTLYPMIIEKIKQADQASLNAFINDTGLSMFVKIPDITNKEQRDNVSDALKNMLSQMKQTGSMAMIIDKKWDIESNDKIIPSKISNELRQSVASEFCSIFGIPPSYLGVDANNSYGQQSSIVASYGDRALKPILTNLFQKLNNNFFPLEFSKTGKLAPRERLTYSLLDLGGLSTNDQVEYLSKLINNGIITANEARLRLGLEASEDANILYANSALQPIKSIANKVDAETDKLIAEAESIRNGSSVKPINEENS